VTKLLIGKILATIYLVVMIAIMGITSLLLETNSPTYYMALDTLYLMIAPVVVIGVVSMLYSIWTLTEEESGD